MKKSEKFRKHHHAFWISIETNQKINKDLVTDWLDKHLPNLPMLESSDVGKITDTCRITELLIKAER